MKRTVLLSTIAAIGISLLLVTTFASFAAGTTVTVQTNAASYQASPGTSIIISGSVSPAPGVSGEMISIHIEAPGGSSFIQSASVDATTGAYSETFVTGPASSGYPNGTYTVTATYAASISSPTYTATTSFQYGAAGTTTSTTSTATPTTTTVTTTITSTTTSVSTTTQSTTTTAISTVTTPTTITTTTTMTQTSMTWEYIGIAGIAAAIALAGVAVFSMRRR